MIERCNYLFESRVMIELGIITGPAGRGKTTAVQHYVTQTPHSIYMRFNEDMRYGNRIYSEVAYRLTGTRPEKTRQAWQIVEKAMTERRWLLFFDEADRMSLRHLNALRDLHDNFNVPVIFVGEEPLIDKVDSERRLSDRLGFRIKFNPVNEVDIVLTFKVFEVCLEVLDKESLQKALELIKTKSNGTFRPVVSLARETKRIMRVNSLDKISLDVIQTVCKGVK